MIEIRKGVSQYGRMHVCMLPQRANGLVRGQGRISVRVTCRTVYGMKRGRTVCFFRWERNAPPLTPPRYTVHIFHTCTHIRTHTHTHTFTFLCTCNTFIQTYTVLYCTVPTCNSLSLIYIYIRRTFHNVQSSGAANYTHTYGHTHTHTHIYAHTYAHARTSTIFQHTPPPRTIIAPREY